MPSPHLLQPQTADSCLSLLTTFTLFIRPAGFRRFLKLLVQAGCSGKKSKWKAAVVSRKLCTNHSHCFLCQQQSRLPHFKSLKWRSGAGGCSVWRKERVRVQRDRMICGPVFTPTPPTSLCGSPQTFTTVETDNGLPLLPPRCFS